MKRTTFQVHHYSPLPLLRMLTRSDRRENNESTLLHSIKCQETPRCAKWSGAEFQHKDDLLQSSRIVWLPGRLSIFQLGTHLTLKVLHCAHFNLRVSGTSKKKTKQNKVCLQIAGDIWSYLCVQTGGKSMFCSLPFFNCWRQLLQQQPLRCPQLSAFSGTDSTWKAAAVAAAPSENLIKTVLKGD